MQIAKILNEAIKNDSITLKEISKQSGIDLKTLKQYQQFISLPTESDRQKIIESIKTLKIIKKLPGRNHKVKVIGSILNLIMFAGYFIFQYGIYEGKKFENFSFLYLESIFVIIVLIHLIPLIANFFYGVFTVRKTKLSIINIVFSIIVILPYLGFYISNFTIHDSTIIKNDISYVEKVEKKLGIDLPDNLEIYSRVEGEIELTVCKLLDQNDVVEFSNKIKNNTRWSDSTPLGLVDQANAVPEFEADIAIQFCRDDLKKTLIYNETTHFYGDSFDVGEYKIVVMNFNEELGKISILNNFPVSFVEE